MGALESRQSLAGGFLLLLGSLGLPKDAPSELQCYLMVPTNDMNCTWEPGPDPGVLYTFFYQSKKYDPDRTQETQVPIGQHWVLIKRESLTESDLYQVWVRSAHHPPSPRDPEPLLVDLDNIVKPNPPKMSPNVEYSNDSLEVTVTWTPPEWSYPQTFIYQLRYRTHVSPAWIQLDPEDTFMGHFILQALEPARRYEVAIRCRLQDEKGFWSDWSPSISFWSVPAAPSSLVNLWVSASLCSPKPGGNSPLLLWKPLPNEANLSYEVVFRVRGCDLPPVVLPCCQASLPRDAEWAGVLAFNPTGRTPFANLTLKCAGSAPEGVRVKSTGNQGLLVTWEPGRGGEPQEYVVEWTSDVQTPQELHWIRLQAGEHRALLNGSFPPAVPFQVVVSGIFPQGLGRSLPARGYGQETVPSAGPALQRLQDDPGGAPVVAWEQLPFRQRGGHLISYNLYVQAGTSPPTLCIVSADTQNLTLRNLVSSGRYKLWMTATTSAGEGFPGPSLLLQLPENTVRWKVLLGCLLLPGLLLLGCGLGLAFSKRCLHICHKLPPRWLWEDTPDPFNSRAAWTEEEDVPRALPPQEPPLLEVEEMEPLTAPQPGVAGQQPLHTFGYERHFLPTPEELGLYSAGQVDCTQVTMQPGEEEVQDDGERGPEETAGTEKCENLLALGEKGEINTGPEMTGVSQSLEGSPPRLLSSPL